MLGWLDFLGPLKWPSILLTIVAPLAAYPFWSPAEEPHLLLQRIGVPGGSILVLGRRAEAEIELRFTLASGGAEEGSATAITAGRLPGEPEWRAAEFDAGAAELSLPAGTDPALQVELLVQGSEGDREAIVPISLDVSRLQPGR